MIRVGLVDDQTLVRAGIRALLGLVPDVEVAFEAEDGASALRALEETGADVVLLDLRMPGLDGIGVLRALRGTGRLPPTIVLTTFDDDALMLEAIRLGARGFLLKDISLERLTEAIRTVAAGGTLLQPAITERLLRAALGAGIGGFDSSVAPEPLTEREVEVLRLMTGGCSNREIADSLGVAEGTAKNHISNILAKLGVRDRTRAVLKALELGLV